MSELRHYCDLLIQQVAAVKEACRHVEGEPEPEIDTKLNSSTSQLIGMCETFIGALEECIPAASHTHNPSVVISTPTTAADATPAPSVTPPKMDTAASTDATLPRVLAIIHVDGEEEAKKPIRAKLLTQAEAQCRRVYQRIQSHKLKRILVFDKEFGEYVDVMGDDYTLSDREKMILHFDSSCEQATTYTRPSVVPPPWPPVVSPPDVVLPPSGLSAMELLDEAEEIDKIETSHKAPAVRATNSVQITLSDTDIEERARIFGQNPKQKLNCYQKKINAHATEAARENPSLLENRGLLLSEARKRLHDSGYVYAHGKRSRSKVFGLPRPRVNISRKKRFEELSEEMLSLRTQIELMERGKSEAVTSSHFGKAASFLEQGTQLRRKLKELEKEMVELEKYRARVAKRKAQRRNARETSGE